MKSKNFGTNKKNDLLWILLAAFSVLIAVNVFLFCFVFKPSTVEPEQSPPSSVMEDPVSSTAVSSEEELFTNWRDGLTCTASTYREKNRWGEEFSPENAIDSNLETAWYEDVEGFGYGEWIRLDFTERKIMGISLINGHSLADNDFSRYYANSRIKRVAIEAQDYYQEFELRDGVTTFQNLSFNREVKTSYVKITILEVYEGDDDKMSCISEIRVF